MMGSGGMVVVDDTTCMVDFAKFFFKFTAEESCGKCVPCRVGTQRILEILERISAGEGTLEDVDQLEQLSDDVIEGSLCQLGGSAPNPVLTTLRYFRDEVMEHVSTSAARQRSAGRSSATSSTRTTAPAATSATTPAPPVPSPASVRRLHMIDQRKCIKCDTCRQVCNFDAIHVETGILTVAEGRQR